MKYISTLIFAVALIYSWKLIHKETSIPFETHASLQLKLIEIIKRSVSEIKPLAEGIEIQNISTAPIDDHTVRAFFSYKFQEPDSETGDRTEQHIEGEAILRRKTSAEATTDQWIMENVAIKNGNMTFKNGIVITPTPASDISNSQVPADTVPTQLEAPPSQPGPTQPATESNQHE